MGRHEKQREMKIKPLSDKRREEVVDILAQMDMPEAVRDSDGNIMRDKKGLPVLQMTKDRRPIFKSFFDWTKDECLAFYDALHSGDAALAKHAMEICAQGAMEPSSRGLEGLVIRGGLERYLLTMYPNHKEEYADCATDISQDIWALVQKLVPLEYDPIHVIRKKKKKEAVVDPDDDEAESEEEQEMESSEDDDLEQQIQEHGYISVGIYVKKKLWRRTITTFETEEGTDRQRQQAKYRDTRNRRNRALATLADRGMTSPSNGTIRWQIMLDSEIDHDQLKEPGHGRAATMTPLSTLYHIEEEQKLFVSGDAQISDDTEGTLWDMIAANKDIDDYMDMENADVVPALIMKIGKEGIKMVPEPYKSLLWIEAMACQEEHDQHGVAKLKQNAKIERAYREKFPDAPKNLNFAKMRWTMLQELSRIMYILGVSRVGKRSSLQPIKAERNFLITAEDLDQEADIDDSFMSDMEEDIYNSLDHVMTAKRRNE